MMEFVSPFLGLDALCPAPIQNIFSDHKIWGGADVFVVGVSET